MMTPRFDGHGSWDEGSMPSGSGRGGSSRGGRASSQRSQSTRYDGAAATLGGDAVVEIERVGDGRDGERE